MIYLLLCIVSSSLLMVIFKIAGRKNLDNFQVIVYNYITAALFGFIIGGFPGKGFFNSPWLPFSLIIGVLFILIFLVMARSTQLSGISPTTIATKMSVVIPITFSIIYFNEETGILKVAGITLAIASVFLAVYRTEERREIRSAATIFPLLLFFGSGTIDSLIKYTQETYLGPGSSILFSSTLFIIAATSGILIAPFRKKSKHTWFSGKTIIAGIILGIVNFGSLYGIIMSLNSRVFDSSIIFGINNIGIVLLSIVIALLIFSEKLSRINIIGIILSLISIIILSKV